MSEYLRGLLFETVKKNGIVFITMCVGIITLLFGLFLYFSDNKKPIEFVEADREERTENTQSLFVDISGGVTNPGLYELPQNSRVNDVIQAAGGFSEDADSVAVSRVINLAKLLTDGEKIYIPLVSEESPVLSESHSINTGLININTATQPALEALPGIGPVTAQKIIDGRPYSTIDELLEKKIVGQKTFEKISSQISTY